MVNEALFSSERQDWGTPIDFFNKLNEKYGFTLDAAASRDNAKCEIFFYGRRGRFVEILARA